MKPAIKSIGVRELRQNASEYLRLVEGGESIQITDRGRPVAMLVPIDPEETIVERLVREGKLKYGRGNLLGLGPPPELPGEPLTETLAKMRDDERY